MYESRKPGSSDSTVRARYSSELLTVPPVARDRTGESTGRLGRPLAAGIGRRVLALGDNCHNPKSGDLYRPVMEIASDPTCSSNT